MERLLKIDTSTRKTDSYSRDLASRYEKKWKEKNPDSEVIYRDLNEINIPHLTQEMIDAMYTSLEERDSNINETLFLSDTLISEIKNADTILLSTPMFNFGIPSSLKAYIDHIVRPEETFSMDESGFTGLLTGKKLVIIAAYGADFSNMKEMDLVEPYLKSLFGFLGFIDIEYYTIEGTSMLSSEILENKKRELVNLF